MIIATAGHVDHGKTSLVRALTGVDTDRLAEEKRRGLSIDLGFAYSATAGGHSLGFVDVPGHERFIRNMLAGIAAIDYALLVVAADDGPMPQTREHLAILDLLGVDRGAVALSKIDRADSTRQAQVASEIRALLAPTPLRDAPLFPVASPTGDGVPALRAHLEQVAAGLPDRRGGGNFRLAIDRSFTIAGAGLVVTGAVFAGAVTIGDRLLLSPAGIEVRVRGIHAQNLPAARGQAGQRCAINIVGPELKRAAPQRGDWLLAVAAHAPTARLDVELRLLATEARPLAQDTPVHLHLGAAAATGRVTILQDRAIAPGMTGLAQLRLDRPIGALYGDRFVLRDQSARRTIAGGRIIDPFGHGRGRTRPARLLQLAALAEPDAGTALAALLDGSEHGVDLAAFARGRNLDPASIATLPSTIAMESVATEDGTLALAPRHWQALRAAICQRLGEIHAAAPALLGIDERDLRQALTSAGTGATPLPLLRAAVGELLRTGSLRRQGMLLRLADHRPVLAPADSALWRRLRPSLAACQPRPPVLGELAVSLSLSVPEAQQALQHCARLGLLVAGGGNRFFLPAAIAELAIVAERLAAETPADGFDAASFRDRSQIGRNLTIQILELFDRAGLTRRVGDRRRLLRPAAEVFGMAGLPTAGPDMLG